MPSWKTVLRISLITMGTMFAMNQLAAMNPMFRQIIKGSKLSPVPSNATGNQNTGATWV